MLKKVIYVNKGGLQTCHIPSEELERIKLEGKIFFDPKYRAQFQRKIASCAEEFKIFFSGYKEFDVGELSNAGLLKFFDGYSDRLKRMFAYYQVSGGRSFSLLEHHVREYLPKHFAGENLEEIYGLLLTPTELDLLNREEIDLRKLAVNEVVPEEDLRTHALNYSLLFFGTYDEQIIIDSIKNRVSEAKRNKLSHEKYLEEILAAKKKVEAKRQKLLARIDDSDLLDLIAFLREQGRIRFEYKEWKNGAEYKFLGLFKEIASRIGIGVGEYLKTYRLDETRDFLKSGVVVSDPERMARKNVFVFFQDNAKKEFFSGSMAEKMAADVLGADSNDAAELKGTPASPGHVEGRAKVIIFRGLDALYADIADFVQGDILVTTMTQPNMVFLMEKAGAIVTDQGGMTSHAAIIAREFGIPCIVGTYKATQKFRNGDLLDVDATKGTVRVIKRADE
ncbi:MAG: hypothetical protein HY394_03815 [Candidatus Diapherotrites archaeon]|nr:hypothetical protein [Candidatus Diapherotrites archaeon]